jgi:hypothetical protein
MLLTPNSLWTLRNILGWSAGKYGAKRHSGVHFLLWNLHAAQACVVPPLRVIIIFFPHPVRKMLEKKYDPE